MIRKCNQRVDVCLNIEINKKEKNRDNSVVVKQTNVCIQLTQQ